MLNIALTFADEDNNKLYKVADALHKAVPSVYLLGENSVPHISITHIDGEEVDAESMWNTLIRRGLKTEYDLVLKTFTVGAPKDDGRGYTNFSMEEFGKFSKVQDVVMETFPEREVHSGVGAHFDPHITTSCHLDAKFARIPAQKAPFKRVKAYLTVGTRDSYGRMERILMGGYKG